jgi:predicted glycosyltransferase
MTGHDRICAWVTKYGSGNLGARLRARPSLSFNDDDADVVPFIAWTSYPFANQILATQWTRMGRFEPKTRHYPGFHELFYLHPNRFTPEASIHAELGLRTDEPFALLRLSALTAHHDVGVRGVQDSLARRILACCEGRTRLLISSERPLPQDLERYRCSIPVDRIHHALAAAVFFVGDSQTMTAESAVLGTPALRLNDFVGRIGYLAELERRGLAFGYRYTEKDAMLRHIYELLASGGWRAEYAHRRARLLADCPDPVPGFAERIMDLVTGNER